MNENPTVFVVDDDLAVRESLAVMVRAMNMQATCFASAEEFLAQYKRSLAGCLVLDLRMPGMSGFELQERLLADQIELPIIIMTGHGDVPMSVRAMKHGAIDFLEKPYQPRQMRHSILQAIQRDSDSRKDHGQRLRARALIRELNNVERRVMEGIVAGKPNKDIAAELDVSLRTVQFRRKSLMEKLRVNSRAALVQLVFSSR